jgi:hypothetical protein
MMGKENMGFYGYFLFICLFASYEHHGFISRWHLMCHDSFFGCIFGGVVVFALML